VTWLLREDLLAWLAAVLLASGTILAGVGLLPWRERWGRVARWSIGLGGYGLLLSLLARGIQAGGLPLVSTYEVVLLAAAATALVYAVGMPRWLDNIGGLCAGAVGFLMVLLALSLTPAGARVPQPPPPILRGILFPLHVATTALGYGGLLLSGCAGMVGLLVGPRGGAARSRLSIGAEGTELAAARFRGDLERLAWRALAWGYPWLTLGMTLGAWWGWMAWGRYWSWSVKEILTLLTWGFFALAFHTRRLKGWRGRPHAAILVAGVILLLLTLLAAEAIASRFMVVVRYVF
jgi:ABC-type transport system involved in cytochrome c biogenesis permease subunit